MEYIKSSSNSKIKKLKKYYEFSKYRNEDGIYLIEGKKLLMEVDRNSICEIYLACDFAYENEDIIKNFNNKPIYYVDDRLFKSIVRCNTPSGVAAIIKRKYYDFEKFLDANKAHILIGEHIQDPGNVGSMIRSAAAAGFDAIILDKMSADIYNPKCVAASMGGIFKLPIFYEESIPSTIKKLQKKGFCCLACAMNGKDRYDKFQYPMKVAIIVGNEGGGLTSESINLSDNIIKIPMVAMESLNVSVAAAILMYEIMKNKL